MIFWSKGPHSKAEHIAVNKERDKRTRAHKLHMQMAEAQSEDGKKASGYAEPSEPEAGIDQDAKSQLGRQAQVAKEIISDKSRQLRSMRVRVRHGRVRARRRGRALGF